MKQKKKQDQYTVYERHGQLVLALNSEIMLPENAPVRLLSAQLEELEYGKLYEAYSSKGRKSAAEPRVLFKVLVHGYLCGIYSSRKLEEACQYRIDFRWLLEDRKAPDHSTLARFRTGRCKEAVEDLFYPRGRIRLEWARREQLHFAAVLLYQWDCPQNMAVLFFVPLQSRSTQYFAHTDRGDNPYGEKDTGR